MALSSDSRGSESCRWGVRLSFGVILSPLVGCPRHYRCVPLRLNSLLMRTSTGRAATCWTCRSRRDGRSRATISSACSRGEKCPKEALIEALFKLYSDAGTEVTYVSESGKTLRYWPKRYLQALRRAVENDEVIGFVEGLVTREESRGFGYLEDAGRLDLTVEAVVVERFPELFEAEVVAAARDRLLAHGYEPKAEPVEARQPVAVGLTPGSNVLVEISVGASGELAARLA